MLIPRTAIFLRKGNAYLLLKGAPSKRLWANKYNGLGGHVEQGEDILSAANRELSEETGLQADLWQCGTVVIDTGQNPGICLYIFCGDYSVGIVQPSIEGMAEWIEYADLNNRAVVEDLPILLGRIHGMSRGAPPFSARSFYDETDTLNVNFG